MIVVGVALFILLLVIAVVMVCYPSPQSPVNQKESELLTGFTQETISDRVRQLLIEDQKIAAVKAYKDETGVGLAEAKAAVEAFQGSNRESTKETKGSSIRCNRCGYRQPIKSFRMYNFCPKCKASYGDSNIY